ncbi:hypothetical protein ACLI09_06030 [Flavobacterium sp. RHBU_24]|uniref:hypothetical protein n=1 Tax=Flavobacterium sp. RHBU_24 TaxID=3391185 RepID=UPI003984D42C
MERIMNTNIRKNDSATISFMVAAAEIDKSVKGAEEVSCSLQLKNLLKTNVKLLKLNEISSIILF